MGELNILQLVAVSVIPVLFAITMHEVSHGWVASRLGDPTAKMLGRLSLNPIRHIDPVGTVLVPLVLLIMTSLGGGAPFMFGWAKPAPITVRNLTKPRRDTALVAIAGPLSNLLMAFFWAVVLRLGSELVASSPPVGMFLIYSGEIGIIINAILLAVNILPLPPLDGSAVVSSLLPPRWAWHYNSLEKFGFPILLILLITNILSEILSPIVSLVWDLVIKFVGL